LLVYILHKSFDIVFAKLDFLENASNDSTSIASVLSFFVYNWDISPL